MEAAIPSIPKPGASGRISGTSMPTKKRAIGQHRKKQINYVAEPTCAQFHASGKFIRGIMGPIGSGKSTACVMEIIYRAINQKPDGEGVRKSRWAVVRNTYPQLKTTTINTWKMWVPEEFCPIKMQPPITGVLNHPLPDGTTVWLEVIFLALDKAEDVDKLRSLELTGCWLNEASEINEEVFKMSRGRVRRFPPKVDGEVGYNWSGVIMDTNPPDEGSWYYRYAEIDTPRKAEFFKQPPALIRLPKKSEDLPDIYIANPDAENAIHQNAGYEYWLDLADGADRAWIDRNLLNHYGITIKGKPVYEDFSETFHVSKEEIEAIRERMIFIGMDYGLTPSAVFVQVTSLGQLRILGELVADNMGIKRFSEDFMKPYLNDRFPGIPYMCISDPAGGQRSQTDESRCIQVMNELGIDTIPAPTNLFMPRREAVINFLTKTIGGDPGLLIDPSCRMIIDGFRGKYCFQQINSSQLTQFGGSRYSVSPVKNQWSHPHDALQYVSLHLSEGSGRITTPYGGRIISGRGEARNVVVAPAGGWT